MDSSSFADKSQAEAYLAKTLPEATAANPPYKAADSDLETRWLTKSVTFAKAADGGLRVEMREAVLDYRGGKLAREGAHDAAFALDDVDILYVDDNGAIVDDVARAAGVLFKCRAAPRIATVRDGKSSQEAATDISIADASTRAQVYAAFRVLQSP